MRRTVVKGVDIDPYLRALRTELQVPGEFPAEVQAEATRAATARARDSWSRDGRADATDLDLVTLDPTGSRDLDQAFALERGKSGLVLHYAIADVGAFVTPGGAIDGDQARQFQPTDLPVGAHCASHSTHAPG